MIDGQGRDTQINLCDNCEHVGGFPICIPHNVVFGDGIGADNIIECSNHKIMGEIETDEIPSSDNVTSDNVECDIKDYCGNACDGAGHCD